MHGLRLAIPALPRRCALCLGDAGPHGFCAGCRGDLPWQRRACARCALPLVEAAAPECGRCRVRPPPWHRALAPLAWSWPVDAALRALKFSGRLEFAFAFGEILADALAGARALPAPDCVCPVPLHRWRHLRRGFNQATELCRVLCLRHGLPLDDSLRRVRATPPQSGLSRRARQRNLAGAFALRGSLRGRHPLLVDDVMTTGATCARLAALLRRHGAETVTVLTVARAA